MRFAGRVAVVTGAGRGLGREYALFLAGRGACVVVNDVGAGADGSGSSEGPATAVAREIEVLGGSAVSSTHDVSTRAGAQSLIEAALGAYGRVELLVNNAGITEGDWESMIAVNLSATFYTCKAAWPHFESQRFGRVVNTTSAAGLFGLQHDTPHGLDFFAYAAAKMGIVGLTRNLAQLGDGIGIKANSVAPVAFSRLTANYPDPRVNSWLKRHFDPARVAPVVAALLHDECPFSGETFSVGGGRVARVFVGETLGIAEEVLSGEGFLERATAVVDEERYFVPRDTAQEMDYFRTSLRRVETA